MKMKAFFVLILATFVKSDRNTSILKCCREGYLTVPRNLSCLEPQTRHTLPVQYSCKQLIAYRNNYTINEAGELMFKSSGGLTHTFLPSKYCLGNNTKITKEIDLTRIREWPMLCADPEEVILDIRVISYCFIVSTIFLAITSIIYAALPDLRRDLQGKSLINLCSSLSLALAMLAILRLVPYKDMSLCAIRGFFCYFFMMVSFFWTNAIAIQVLRSVRRPTIGTNGWKEFGWYALYAWGCGALLTICMAVVNFHPGDHDKPGIGLNHCWFYEKRQQWYYMYSVMTILLSANVAIFIYTSTLIWRHSFSSSNIRALKYKLVMTTRLIILMGLPWIFEMIISLAEDHIIWAILNVFNSLQGLLIFLLLVVFRKRAVRAMHAQGWLACVAGPVERYLARGADDEELAVHHTEVPMTDHKGVIACKD